MDTDGLILNIDLDYSGPQKSTTESRRSTFRLAEPVKRKLETPIRERDTTSKRGGDDRTQPPRKRLKVDKPHDTPSRHPPRPPKPALNPLKDPPTTLENPGQKISSLFTSNPVVDLPPAPEPQPLLPPSNAPLKDASTFEGLGLNTLVIKHLKDKFNINKPTAVQRASLSAILNQAPSEHRDLFIQSQTGSGKTLSFLLPIIHDLLPLSSLSYIDRSIGTLAMIIAPTRELAKQISDVLESLLQMRLSARESERTDNEETPRLTRWLISGLLVGGGTRTHEKARLRKGIPILVSTPGRLLDHLQNTESFCVAKCRWLILDEADRLMELGFHDTLAGIIKALDGRRRNAIEASKHGEGLGGEIVGGWDWGLRRRTILCSATMREDVQKLAGTALVQPLVIKGVETGTLPKPFSPTSGLLDGPSPSVDVVAPTTKFTPPSQLSQKYILVPLKLRLVTLVSLLRSILSQPETDRNKRPSSPQATKVIVFFSSTDSVDFHWELLRGTTMSEEGGDGASSDSEDEDDIDPKGKDEESKLIKVEARSALIPETSIYRLHGSLPLPARQAAIRGFSQSKHDKKGRSGANMSILFCTSVASRGLDLPLVRAVVQYDLPTEGGCTEYVHRVGRTARVGKGGEAWAFVAPEEVAWVQWVEQGMEGAEGLPSGLSALPPPEAAERSPKLIPVESDDVLTKGFGGDVGEAHRRATDVQLAFERWVLHKKSHSESAQRAFKSHMRAYATHPSGEKHIFHMRNLHIGHLAKSFALRDAPSNVKGVPKSTRHSAPKGTKVPKKDTEDKSTSGPSKAHDKVKAIPQKLSVAERMKAVMRTQGRLTKRDGQFVSATADEFQIAGADLEKLVKRAR